MFCHPILQFSMLFLTLILFGSNFLGMCNGYALTNQLSQHICESYNNKKFDRVQPASASASKICPIVIKYEKNWKYKTCGSSSGNAGTNSSHSGSGNSSSPVIPRTQTGHTAEPQTYPYIAYIPGKNTDGDRKSLDIQGIIYNQHTIISTVKIMKLRAGYGGEPNWIHNIPVRLGKYNISEHENFEQTRFICNLTIHPNKDEDESNAFSLLHLSEPILFNEFVGTIPIFYERIPVRDEGKDSSDTTISNNCLLAGWGDVKYADTTDVLYEANVTVHDQCKLDGKVMKGLLCTDNGDDQTNVHCYGDSGEPLICSDKGKLFARAIVMDDGNRECDKRYPTYFLHFNRPHILKWIETEYNNHRELCRADY